jgi:hypothetical protein
MAGTTNTDGASDVLLQSPGVTVAQGNGPRDDEPSGTKQTADLTNG